MHRKARTGGRCINTFATRISNSLDAGLASILSGSADTYGFALCWALVMRWKCMETGRELP